MDRDRIYLVVWIGVFIMLYSFFHIALRCYGEIVGTTWGELSPEVALFALLFGALMVVVGMTLANRLDDIELSEWREKRREERKRRRGGA